jgi:hypothetical protein
MMRRSFQSLGLVCFAAAVFGAAAGARAVAPVPLEEAIQKLIHDQDHWAYTQQTQLFDKAGKPNGGPTVERYDPSLPFDQQWQLLQFSGHVPTGDELAGWRRTKEKEMKHHGEKTLGDLLDLDHAALFAHAPDRDTFLVPLFKNATTRFPADKVEVFMDVDPARHTLTSFSVRPKQPFRIAGIFRVDSGQFDGRLEVIQPKYAPALVWAKGNGSGHVLGLFKVGMGAELNFSGFKRVLPFNDRFEVKIGDVKALNF